MKGDFRCFDGRRLISDPQPDDPFLERNRGICPDCNGRGCGAPEALGVSRMSDNDRAILVSFSKALTDDEMRDFHDYVREWEP